MDFDVEDKTALAVFLDSTSGTLEVSAGKGWYKSSDEKMLAGVCSGLAHKMGNTATGMRVATVLLSILFLLPIVVYVVLWAVLPDKPTKKAE